MEYAYNNEGKLEEARYAVKGKNYVCPYCGETNLTLKQGTVNAASFSHRKISDRTPLQRTCPEYHDNEYGSINDPAQKLYILNGGIPVYLKSYKNQFFISAIFPRLSESSMKFLRDNQIKLYIGNNKTVKNISDYIELRIDDFKSKWINVSLNVSCIIPEIKNKWLCGIQGLADLDNTVFKCGESGGVRLPHNSRIYIGMKYNLICSSDVFLCKFKKHGNEYYNDGVFLKRIGSLNRDNYYWHTQKYTVYEFIIQKNTQTAQEFIFSRYYTLCESKSSVIPLWPPTIIEGNQLIYNNETEAFFHKMNALDEKIGYEIYLGAIRTLNERREVIKINPSVYNCLYINFKESINSSEKIDRNIIQWHITIRNKINNTFKPIYELHDKSENVIYPGKNEKKYDTITTYFNVPASLIIKQGEYVKIKTNGTLTKGDFINTVIRLDACGYGNKMYDFSVKKAKNINNVTIGNWTAIAKAFYVLQSSPMVKINCHVIYFYNMLPKSELKLKAMLSRWLQLGQIPLSVSNYILKFIKDSEINESKK